MKKTLLLLIGTLFLIILLSFKVEKENLAYTTYQYWSNTLKPQCIDAGGTQGLINETTSLTTAWTMLKSSSDAKLDGTKITDGLGNVYYKYVQSSTATLQGKGYNLVGTISISSGPNSTQKIRFTKP